MKLARALPPVRAAAPAVPSYSRPWSRRRGTRETGGGLLHDWEPREDAKTWGIPEWLALAAVVVAAILAVVLVVRRSSL